MPAGRSHTKTSVANKTRYVLPRLPFNAAKNAVLGTPYELSIAFIGKAAMAKLNKTYRNKDGPTDILSFTVDKNVGEIIICPSVAKKKAFSFGESTPAYLFRLLIHGLVHLKGYDHGSTMERYERRLRKRFSR